MPPIRRHIWECFLLMTHPNHNVVESHRHLFKATPHNSRVFRLESLEAPDCTISCIFSVIPLKSPARSTYFKRSLLQSGPRLPAFLEGKICGGKPQATACGLYTNQNCAVQPQYLKYPKLPFITSISKTTSTKPSRAINTINNLFNHFLYSIIVFW